MKDRLIELGDALSASAEPSAPIKMEALGQTFAQILADNADDLILKSSAPVEHDGRADAERYRWIEKQPYAWAVIGEAFNLPSEHDGANSLRDSIDKARAALERKP